MGARIKQAVTAIMDVMTEGASCNIPDTRYYRAHKRKTHILAESVADAINNDALLVSGTMKKSFFKAINEFPKTATKHEKKKFGMSQRKTRQKRLIQE